MDTFRKYHRPRTVIILIILIGGNSKPFCYKVPQIGLSPL